MEQKLRQLGNLHVQIVMPEHTALHQRNMPVQLEDFELLDQLEERYD